MTVKLPPLPQSWYDDNRERFGADTQSVDLSSLTKPVCNHLMKRITAREVCCVRCHTGWYDEGRFVITDGQLTSISP